MFDKLVILNSYWLYRYLENGAKNPNMEIDQNVPIFGSFFLFAVYKYGRTCNIFCERIFQRPDSQYDIH